MNTKIALLTLTLSLVLVGVGCSQESTTTNTSEANTTTVEEVMEKDDAMIEEDAMEKDPAIGSVEVSKDDNMESLSSAPGQYVDYEAGAVSAAATKGDAVLFFHAPWCPTCKTLNDDLEASRDDIPEGLSIFKTDYDTSTELKKKYGVTYQHTLVQVDSEGNMITKWSGGNTLESITAKVQ